MPPVSKDSLYQQFSVHAVGQGFFYSGCVRTDDHSFKFAFDCGSYSPDSILREIGSFEEEVMEDDDQLDLLVISHFDEDHVNHIADLLENVKKVKRLVLPFLHFEDRLFLVLRMMEQQRSGRSRSAIASRLDTMQLILDPTGYLSDYLDGGSEVYFFQNPDDPDGSDGNNGISPVGRRKNNPEFDDFFSQDQRGISFDIRPRIRLTTDEIRLLRVSPNSAMMFMVADTSIGLLSVDFERVMEFVFYKRPLDHSEEKFYRLVADGFKAKYLLEDLGLETVLEAVKEIKNAKELKEIFKSAAKECGLPVSKTADMNTTALCMLHRNLPGILDKFSPARWREFRHWGSPYPFTSIELRNYFGKPGYDYVHYGPHLSSWVDGEVLFPNTLLTSDAFIKKDADLKRFLDRFAPYLAEVWLIQVPHHGSKKNITEDFVGHEAFNERVCFFINYGLINRSGHPDPEVIGWLQHNVEHRQLFLVNERQGLHFYFFLEN